MPGELTTAEQVAVWDRRGAHPAAYPAEPDAPLIERLCPIPAKLRQALDLGCGHGRHLLLLASMGWRITGLDWSPAALAIAKQRLEAAGRHGNLVRGDCRHLPFGPASFHLIIATAVLHHGRLADFRRAMQEVKRVLFAGCHAIISVPTLNNAPLAPAGEWVESGTLVLSTGSEAGLPHHFFSDGEIQANPAQFRQVQVDRVVQPLPPGTGPLHERHINEWYWMTLTG
jgi:SAM-dependent methyltransferase